MAVDLHTIIEDFERLWHVDGLAEIFSAKLAGSLPRTDPPGPGDVILEEHQRLLLNALRTRERVASDREAAAAAQALCGVYLSRRLAGAPLTTWVEDAIATVLHPPPTTPPFNEEPAE